MNAGARKVFFSGWAFVVVVCWGIVLAWGVVVADRSGWVWDASGRALLEARYRVAELPPGARVIAVDPTPILVPLRAVARGGGRLRITRVGAGEGPLSPPGSSLRMGPGDVRVAVGERWQVLHTPTLTQVLDALGAVASPLPLEAPGSGVGRWGDGEVRSGPEPLLRARTWGSLGLLWPLLVSALGLGWQARRRGR